MLDVGLVLLEICPLAPPGAQKYADQLTGGTAPSLLDSF